MSATDGRPEAERLSSRPIYRGRVLDLDVDRVRLPHGGAAEMELVHQRGAAAVVPVLGVGEGEEVLLVRQYRYATGGWLLEIPAGRLDGGERPQEAARRELVEETGYRAADLEPLGWLWPAPGTSDEKVWLFVARGLEPAAQALEPDEVLRVERQPLADAVARAVSGEIHDAKTALALLRLSARRGGRS